MAHQPTWYPKQYFTKSVMSSSEILLKYDIPSLINPFCFYARQVQFRIALALKLSLTKLEYFVWLWSNAATHHDGRQLDYLRCTS